MKKNILLLVVLFLTSTESFSQKKLIVTDYDRRFKDGLLAIKQKDYWGYADTSGNMVMDFIIPDFNRFDNEIPGHTKKGFVTSNYPKSGFKIIDTNGKPLSENIFSVIGIYNEGIAPAAIENKNAKSSTPLYINEQGRKLFTLPVPIILGETENLTDYIGEFHEGLAYISRKKKELSGEIFTYGFINTKGKLTIPYKFEKVHSFSNNRCAVAKRNKYNQLKWGFIDSKGNEIIDFIFSHEPKDFSNGFAWVLSTDNLYSLIDTMGNTIVPPTYNKVSVYNEGTGIGYYLGNTSEESFYAVIDSSGKVSNKIYGYIIESQNQHTDSEFLLPMQEGKIIVYAPNEFKYGAINKKGKIIVPLRFTTLKPFTEGRAYAEMDHGNKKGFIDTKGEWGNLV